MKTLSDHERRQEGVEGGSHDVSGPWIEVTIIPVVRLEPCCGEGRYSSVEEAAEHGVTGSWCVEGEDRSAKDQILLGGGGGVDTPGTDPDPAL